MKKLSDFVSNIEESVTLAAAKRAKDLASQGKTLLI